MVLGSFETILTVLVGITALDRLFPSVRLVDALLLYWLA